MAGSAGQRPPLGMIRPKSTHAKVTHVFRIDNCVGTMHNFKKSKIKCIYGAISSEYLYTLNKNIFFLDDPRDYDELAEDEEIHAEGSSTQDVTMEDAHAILNEEDMDSGSSFPPPHSTFILEALPSYITSCLQQTLASEERRRVSPKTHPTTREATP
jgi:hypothetical protein